jgi:hypothetical protein
MRAAAIYRSHDSASQAKYQEVKQLARSQRRILAGTPGVLKQRTQSGKQYWVREYIRVDGKKTDEYIGPATTVDKGTVGRLATEIDLAKALAASSGRLRLYGYQRIERKPAGVIAPGYRTQDIDLARAQPLAIALPSGASLESLLKDTGLGFVPVPGMPSHRPSVSFKLPGAETLAVDLLVPGDQAGKVVAVKELATHAQAVPLLDFLIEDATASVALSPNQVIPVLVPSPERFLLHKIFSSQSRAGGDRDKIRKDLEQAAVLAAAIEEETPGRLKDAFASMPARGKPAVRRGSLAVSKLLENHQEARQTFSRIAAARR